MMNRLLPQLIKIRPDNSLILIILDERLSLFAIECTTQR